jgi:hypothetical protein
VAYHAAFPETSCFSKKQGGLEKQEKQRRGFQSVGILSNVERRTYKSRCLRFPNQSYWKNAGKNMVVKISIPPLMPSRHDLI